MKTRRSLLEYLLEANRGLRADPLSRLAGFADGFWAARYHLGAADPLSEAFFRSLDQRGERSTAGWWAKLSQECGGDQAEAVQKLRALISEFLRHEKGARTDTTGTLFEFLADMRKWLDQDFNPGLPERKLARLAGYVDGYLEARSQFGAPDMLAKGFFDELGKLGRHVERGERTREIWEAALLRACEGNEVVAIRTLLDLAGEFTRLQMLGSGWSVWPREWVEAARQSGEPVEVSNEENTPTGPWMYARISDWVREAMDIFENQGGYAGLSRREYLEKLKPNP